MASIGRAITGVLRPVNLTGTSGQHVFQRTEEPTALFRWGLYLKACGWLQLSLLAICINIATL